MNIFRLFQNKKRKKMYENMLQNAPNCTIQKFFFGEACPQTPPPPPNKRMATPRVTKRFAACHSPSPPESSPPLANPVYAHGLLLSNIFEGICARRIHSGRQLIVCSTLNVYALQNLLGGKND